MKTIIHNYTLLQQKCPVDLDLKDTNSTYMQHFPQLDYSVVDDDGNFVILIVWHDSWLIIQKNYPLYMTIILYTQNRRLV